MTQARFGRDEVLLYDGLRAEAWRRWFHIMEAGAQPLSDRMVALAGVSPGSIVLDIATGLGEPAVTAARAVGPGGRVLATDLSPDMLAFAQERAMALGLGNIEFRVMDANRPDLPDAAFDAVLSRWGLMFLAGLDGALADFRCCLRPGGRFVAAVWGRPEDAPAVSLGNRVVLATLGLPPPDEGPMTPFALSDTEGLMRRTREAGFQDVRGEWFDVIYDFDSPDTFAAYRRDRGAEVKDRIAHVPPEEQARAWRAVAEAARAYMGPGGIVRMRNRAFCMVASR